LRPGGTVRSITALQAVAVLGALIHPGSGPALLMQALWNIGHQICTRPAFGIMLAPLDSRTRDRVGILIGLADAAGWVSGGVFLIAAQSSIGARPLFVLVAAAYLLLLAVARHLDRDYLHALESSVISADASVRIQAMESIRYVSPAGAREHVSRLLQDADPDVRRAAVERLDGLPVESARDIAGSLLQSEQEPRVLAALVGTLPRLFGQRTRALLVDPCRRANDERVLANLVEAIGHAGGAPEPAVEQLVDHPSRRVAAAATLTTLRLATGRAPLSRALSRLSAMIAAPDSGSRSAALMVLGELRRPVFGRAVENLLRDEHAGVRRAAVSVARKLKAAYLLPRLQHIRETDAVQGVRDEARRACRILEDGGAGEIVRIVHRLPPADRARVRALVKDSPTGPRARALACLLRLELPSLPFDLLDLIRRERDPELLEEVIRALEPGRSGVRPLIVWLLAHPGRTSQVLPYLSALGPAMSEQSVAAAVAEAVTELVALDTVRRRVPDAAGPLRALAGSRLEQLLVCVAALESSGDPTALVKSLEGAAGVDRHLASVAIDVLEARLRPAVFRVVGPLLEAWHDEMRFEQLGSRWLGTYGQLLPEIGMHLRPHLPPAAAAALTQLVQETARGT
jgi:hypothetical protein